jgi:hypothetical protein
MNLSSLEKNNVLVKIIVDGLTFFKSYGQIIKQNTIKKNYHNTNNIDLMIKLGVNVYFIQVNYEKNVIDLQSLKNFYNDCLIIQNTFQTNQLYFHYILLTKIPVHGYVIQNSIVKNFYIHQDDLKQNVNNDYLFFEYLLIKLYLYLVETSNLRPGLKSYNSDDIIMTYYPK